MIENLTKLAASGKLDNSFILWGISSQTRDIIAWLRQNGYSKHLLFIVDNFKSDYYHEYEGVPVVSPDNLTKQCKDCVPVIFSIRYPDSIRRQLNAYGFIHIYNLQDLQEKTLEEKCHISYNFKNRSEGKKYLCYVLTGYEPLLWDGTIARIEAFQNSSLDYCLVSSGKYDPVIDHIAERNGWSYLYTEKNQVCFIQNLVIDLHPSAEYIFKMDEDIFIGNNFFSRMIQEFHQIEQHGEYRIGFVVPVIPLNCCGYVSYLSLTGNKEEYERRFGRAYRSRYSAVFSIEETAGFLWDTIDNFDIMAQKFEANKGTRVLDCYYNTGCIMFSRDRWLMMGKWPENPQETGMGTDEAFIYQDNMEKDLSIYEIQGVLAGHLAFGHQKKRMLRYYQKHSGKFLLYKKPEDI